MKENGIRFKIDSNGKTVEIEGEFIDGNIYRMNKPVLCNCKGTNLDEAPNLVYDGDKVYCPECGRHSSEVFTFTDYEEEELDNIHLTYFGTDYFTMQKLYKMSYTLPYNKWMLVSDLFMKLTPEMVDLGDFEPQFVGWVTSNPDEVEELLDIKEELRVKNRVVEDKKINDKKKDKKKLQEVQQIINEVLEEFSVVDTPPLEEGKNMIKLSGEVIDNPLNPKNKYGGGEWFVINKKWIWYVRQNAREGDKWELNNVYVKGSAGGIGKKVKYDKELADKILRLK